MKLSGILDINKTISKDLFKEYNFSDITCASAEKEKREHTLYLNIDRRYIYKFIDVFVNECFKKQKNLILNLTTFLKEMIAV